MTITYDDFLKVDIRSGTVVKAEHYLISPAFDGERVDPRTLDWCIHLSDI